MKFLSADDILDANDLDYKDEVVPEWPKDGEPGTIRLRETSAGRTMEMTDRMNQNPREGMYVLLVYTACDPETDELLFPLTGSEEEQVAQLAAYVAKLKRKNFKVMTRLQFAAMAVNKMSPRKKADDTLKNDSSEAGIEGSRTASPKN